jgi:hypothetical protein
MIQVRFKHHPDLPVAVPVSLPNDAPLSVVWQPAASLGEQPQRLCSTNQCLELLLQAKSDMQEAFQGLPAVAAMTAAEREDLVVSMHASVSR